MVDAEAYLASVHGEAELLCTDCHEGIEELPHEDALPGVDCGTCHDDEAEAFALSTHGKRDDSARMEVSCTSCHGTHEILSMSDPESPLHERRMADVCIRCHRDQAMEKGPDKLTGEQVVQSYHLSVHGRARQKDPDSMVASCNNCHDAHATQPASSPAARVSRGRVAETCGACHEDVLAHYYGSVHGELAREGNPDVAVCTDCHGEHNIRSPANRLSTVSRSQITETCARCHEDASIQAKYLIPIASPSSLYRDSVHGQALLVTGVDEAAACQDCHSSHDILGGHDPASSVSRARIMETCGACHQKILKDYEESVHFKMFRHGVTESAVCTDCHGEHTILGHQDLDSPVYTTRLAKEVCGRCHDSLVINRKYGLSTWRVSTYYESYHGLASRLGDAGVANCASCHEAHRILPQSDPASSIHPDNLRATCGSCHPGASEKFVGSLVHISKELPQQVLSYWIKIIYMILIAVTIGFMVIHNVIIVAHHLREKYRAQKQMAYVVRFPPAVILQHMLLSITFILLVITGFSLSFPEGFLSSLMNSGLGLSESLRANIHRAAAVGMTATLVWHFAAIVCTRRGRAEMKALSLGRQDARDLWNNLVHHMGGKREMPRFDRYDYSEKMEYWALIWGSGVMIVTGLLMWFPVQISAWMGVSRAWVDVANVIHYYEAWLATLAIALWHFFFVIYHPDEYPMALSWLTGKLPLHSMEERHPRELERLEEEGKIQRPEDT